METFDAGWLARREPWDHVARSAALTEVLAGRLRDASTPLSILDLGSGTGSNLRYLWPRLPRPQHWLLTDHDASLLARAPVGLAAPDVVVETRAVDLLAVDLDALVAGRSLVTASALLDLVSESWLARLVEACVRHRAAVLFALTYDGLISAMPADPDDELVQDLVNRHQRLDKGFGPALGATAADRVEALLGAQGWAIRRASTPWRLPPTAGAIQHDLIEGWAAAAAAIEPGCAASIRAWRDRRLAIVRAGASSLVVGHDDGIGYRRF